MYDNWVEELNALTRWAVIVATDDKNALMNRITELRNKIKNTNF